MNKSFKQFCINTATTEHVDILIDVAPRNNGKMYENIIKLMKPKMEILDKINIPFIESVFEDMSEVAEILKDSPNVPDNITLNLSEDLYGKHFNNLNDEEQAIIKVVACYLSIQKIIRRN